MLHLGKRIDPTPPASAHLAHDPADLRFRVRYGEDFRRGSGLGGLGSLRHDQVRTGRRAEGRFICHAGFQAPTILALAVAMIGASVGILLVATVRLAALLAEGFLAAAGGAITLPTITVTAEIEHRPTRRKVTNALAENRGTSGQHRFREGALSKGMMMLGSGSTSIIALGLIIKRS
jgi:hypothetical protein